MFVPEFVYKVETAGGGVIVAAAARHRQHLPAQFGRRDGHDIVSTFPVLCRNVLRDSALDRLPLMNERPAVISIRYSSPSPVARVLSGIQEAGPVHR